jgi:hypothetical protein
MFTNDDQKDLVYCQELELGKDNIFLCENGVLLVYFWLM